MSKRTIVIWAIEFASFTAIAVVLSTATTAAKLWAALPAVIIVASKIAEYLHNVRVRMNIVRYQLQILLTLLPTDGSRVRCTYHRPVHQKLRNRTQLAQAFDYIPDGGGGGRRFPIEKGIIGKVYSIKAPRVENFASDEEYRKRMVAEYNYTTSEVMERTADRRSYVCYPVVEENHKVLGVLYLDSDKPGTFTMDETNPRWRAIRDAGEVIRSNVLAGS
jgi:GAF domain-containing protein